MKILNCNGSKEMYYIKSSENRYYGFEKVKE